MTLDFSNQTRSESIRKMQSEEFDLVIIGGGINGAGAARDAVLRGMKVALIEADDFASGTSSRSSKLIHGGIRYLENLEFHLVFEALSERTKLFALAPHLVHPLRFMIPLYEGGRVGMFKMGLGMWLYDALSLFDAPELHERLTPEATETRQPLLQAKKLLGSYIYSDAYMDDDRLVIETLRSANCKNFACANYVKATGANFDQDQQLTSIKCIDQKSKKEFTIRGRHFLSTVGPWTDQLGSSILKEWKNVLRPTKGVHLTFEKKRFPLSSAVVMGAESRIVFGIPRHEMVIVGTTDTDETSDPSKIVAEPEDVNYLLDVIHQYFPGAHLKSEDIMGSYAGVRPLVKDNSGTAGKTSREHQIWKGAKGLTFVAGGKYTTYRLISEQAVNFCLKDFSIEDRYRFARGASENPLNPLATQETFQHYEEFAQELTDKTKLTSQEIGWLIDRHGGESLELIKNYGQNRSYWQLEACHALDKTMCLHLKDFFTRRTPLFLSQQDHGMTLVKQLLPLFTEHQKWSKDEQDFEVQSLKNHLETELAWRKVTEKE